MWKIVACLLSVSVLLGGCLKKDSGCQNFIDNKIAPYAEEQQVINYLSANGISATKHGSNMYYEILQAGSGGYPVQCSNVKVSYTGKLTNGNTFDSQNNAIFLLAALIDGWRMGLPLIQKGGRIKLYIPPTLGYGTSEFKDASGNVLIPANSVLVFDINLMDFQ